MKFKRVKIFYHQSRSHTNGKSWFFASEDYKPTIMEFISDYVCVCDSLFSEKTTLDELYGNFQDRADLVIPQQAIGELNTHTSMSVGDIIFMDGKLSICLPVRFAELNYIQF